MNFFYITSLINKKLQTKELRHASNKKCLDVHSSENDLVIKDCNGAETQKWSLEPVNWKE